MSAKLLIEPMPRRFQFSLRTLLVAILLFSFSAASFAASVGRDGFFRSEFALMGYVLAAEGIGSLVIRGRTWGIVFALGVAIVAYCLGVIILTPTRD